MTPDYAGNAAKIPGHSQLIPLGGVILWLLLMPPLFFFLGHDRLGFSIITTVGFAIPTISLIVGFSFYLQLKRLTGAKPRLLSICLAIHVALLGFFGAFVGLIWPIILSGPR